MGAHDTNQFILILIALVIPPLAVYLEYNRCNGHVISNIFLTLIGFGVLGIFHAFFCIFNRKPAAPQIHPQYPLYAQYPPPPAATHTVVVVPPGQNYSSPLPQHTYNYYSPQATPPVGSPMPPPPAHNPYR
ncbi:hypothetical protein AX774_g2987 [Zancudomyces culisetae]|uniref:Plasma membrane proteolipid 3 n=1 Tax=Zancudomyces culisetae TaxID=1213189 RepID=A0A1R1PRA6_ZANCU|nr:hypothetical protein AX774_g3572 [Zancudomyces culisetae]OMH83515.1 hypothetical protein AX774_g2987 [Zancudomyces culisetae]|eukprot:OMH82926.1 hypothetical protein AX774_g3572 [Zancudomyces culisetae]